MSDRNNKQWWSGFNAFSGIREHSSNIDWIAYDPTMKLLAVTFQVRNVTQKDARTYLYSIDHDQLRGFIKKVDDLDSWGQAYAVKIKDISTQENYEKCITPSLEWMNEFGAAELLDCGGMGKLGCPRNVFEFHHWLCSVFRNINWDRLIVDPIDSEFSF